MAKKRTLLHGYRKVNQRLDSLAVNLLKAGNREEAGIVSNKSRDIFYARRAVVGTGR